MQSRQRPEHPPGTREKSTECFRGKSRKEGEKRVKPTHLERCCYWKQGERTRELPK